MKHSPEKLGPLLQEWAEEFQNKCVNRCPLKPGLVKLIEGGNIHLNKAMETPEYALVKAEAKVLGLSLSDCAAIGLACVISNREEALMMVAYLRYLTRDFDFGDHRHPMTFSHICDILDEKWPNKISFSLMWIRQKGQFMNQSFDNMLHHVTGETFKYACA